VAQEIAAKMEQAAAAAAASLHASNIRDNVAARPPSDLPPGIPAIWEKAGDKAITGFKQIEGVLEGLKDTISNNRDNLKTYTRDVDRLKEEAPEVARIVRQNKAGTTVLELAKFTPETIELVHQSKRSLALAYQMMETGKIPPELIAELRPHLLAQGNALLQEYADVEVDEIKAMLRKSRRELEAAQQGQYKTGFDRLLHRCQTIGKTPKKQAAYGLLVSMFVTAFAGTNLQSSSTNNTTSTSTDVTLSDVEKYTFMAMIILGFISAGLVTLSFLQLHILTDKTQKSIETFKSNPAAAAQVLTFCNS
jgi:hypothetical protein